MNPMITRRAFAAGAAGMAMAGLGLAGCGADEQAKGTSEASPLRVWDLHGDTIGVLGMHDWAPYNTEEDGDACRDGDFASNNAQIALDRVEGMSLCQCFAIWTSDPNSQKDPLGFYRASVAYFKKQLEAYPDLITQVRTANDVDAALEGGRVAAMLTVENARALESGLDIIEEFVNDGVGMCSLTWNAENPLGGGATAGTGLTKLGKQCVKELETAGIILDVSHLSDASFADLAKCATKPFVASHSNSRTIRGMARNLTDKQILHIVERQGLIGFNYYFDFISSSADPTFDEAAEHIDHLLELGAEDVLALGGDFDGGGGVSWLNGIEDVPGFYGMVSERFGSTVADKMFFANAYGFFKRSK